MFLIHSLPSEKKLKLPNIFNDYSTKTNVRDKRNKLTYRN